MNCFKLFHELDLLVQVYERCSPSVLCTFVTINSSFSTILVQIHCFDHHPTFMFHRYTTTVLGLIHQSPYYHCYPRAASLLAPSSLAQFSAIAALLSSGYLSASAVVVSTPALHRHAVMLLSLAASTPTPIPRSPSSRFTPTATPSASSINL